MRVLKLTKSLTRGDDVLWLQRNLNWLAFPAGAEDGIFGVVTAIAVGRFQIYKGLASDRIYGEKTHRALRDEVTKWQKYLRELHWLTSFADGLAGDWTKQTTRAFQLARRIKADGICGEQTRTELLRAKANLPVFVPQPALKERSEFLILHHTVTAPGWNGNAYDFLVRQDGSIEKKRDLKLPGSHARADRMNYRAIGIGFLGNFHKPSRDFYQANDKNPEELFGIFPMTMAQIDGGRKLIRELSPKLIDLNHILPHRKVTGAQTACPGNEFPFEEIIKG